MIISSIWDRWGPAALLRRAGHTRFFQAIAPLLAGPLDRFLHRLTGGRLTVGQRVAPLLFLHHRGQQSGRQFRTPLFYAPCDGGWFVAATNFGRERHPQWSSNLLAEPEVSIEVRGTHHAVRARLATSDEAARAWPQLVARWPAYETYVDRAAHRGIRMFVLEPRAGDGE